MARVVTVEEQQRQDLRRSALKELKKLGTRRARLAQQAAEVQERTLEQVRLARELGIGAPTIGRELGLTHQAVYQMLQADQGGSS